MKYANSKELTGAMKHSTDGHYLFDNGRFRENPLLVAVKRDMKFRPQACN